MEKSTTAEKATVQLITLFISHTDISSPDKYDFIAFENLFQQVFVYSEGDHIEPCKYKYPPYGPSFSIQNDLAFFKLSLLTD